MPLKYINDKGSASAEISFSIVDYQNSGDERFFILADPKSKLEIRVNYIPSFESDRDPNRFECFYLKILI